VSKYTIATVYYYFLIDFEGIKLDPIETRRQDTEQLLLEAEGIINLYDDE
jgi:hypothetical protein